MKHAGFHRAQVQNRIWTLFWHISPKTCPILFKCCPFHGKMMRMMSLSCCFPLLSYCSLIHLTKTAFSFSYSSLTYDLSSSSSQMNQTSPHHPLHQPHERCSQALNPALLLLLLCPSKGTTSLPRQVKETTWFKRGSSTLIYCVFLKMKTHITPTKPKKHCQATALRGASGFFFHIFPSPCGSCNLSSQIWLANSQSSLYFWATCALVIQDLHPRFRVLDDSFNWKRNCDSDHFPRQLSHCSCRSANFSVPRFEGNIGESLRTNLYSENLDSV